MNKKAADILSSHGADPREFGEPEELPGVLTGPISGSEAMKAWSALRDAFPQTGLWPIIRGEPADFDLDPVDAAATLAGVPEGTVTDVLAERLADEREGLIGNLGVQADPGADVYTLAAAADAANVFALSRKGAAPAVWPAEPARGNVPLNPESVKDIATGHTLETVLLALVPAGYPYEAAAYLGFGGWNETPTPELQVAVLREWYARYGAVPVAMTNSVLECFVERPPQDESESMRLAAEQWLFCGDIVNGATQSVRRLGIELWRSPQWFFWWD